MKKRKLSYLLLIMIGLFMVVHSRVFANDMDYSVSANIPENQIDKSQTYFDLRMKPNQKQEISVLLKNTSDKSATISVVPHTAVTNQNGVIDYGKKIAKDTSLKYEFTDLVKGNTTYKLKPKESRNAIFHVEMPKEEFEGQILGGFRISKVNDEDKKEGKDGVQIENQYAYVIGAKFTEKDGSISPKVVLNEIKPTLQNYRTAVSANLQNIKPTIISGLKINAIVYTKDKKEILHQTKKENMSMAPNSNFDFPISWDNQKLKAGSYHLSLSAEDNKGNKWEFEKDFNIESQESKKMNEVAVDVKDNFNWWLAIGAGVVALLILGLVTYFFKKKSIE